MSMLSELLGQPQAHDASLDDLLRRLQSQTAQNGGFHDVPAQANSTAGTAQNYRPTAQAAAASGHHMYPGPGGLRFPMFSIGGAR